MFDPKSVVEKARKSNSEVEKLYASVEARSTIDIVQSKTSSWSSSTEKRVTKISVAPTSHPEASLYHELKHADLKLSGYKQFLTVLFLTPSPNIKPVLEAIDNEIQHHRFYKDYVSAGFPPKDFYADDDAKTLKRVKRAVQKLDKKEGLPSDWFLSFVSIIAPGGCFSDQQRNAVRAYLKARCPTEIFAALEKVEKVFYDWSTITSLDHADALQKILILLDFDGIWVGRTGDFPNDGFFLGSPFPMTDALWGQ